jgi:hypothetical protein
MKQVYAAAAALTIWLVVGGGPLGAQEADPEGDNLAVFMRAKLVHAQHVLEGICTQDFPLIAKHAQELSLLSQAAGWQVLQTPLYQQHSAEFRRAADAVTKAAQQRNLDGAALAYFQMTMSCVSCHKYVRTVQAARLDRPPSLGPPGLGLGHLLADAPRH